MEKGELETKAEQYKCEMMMTYKKSCNAAQDTSAAADAVTEKPDDGNDEVPDEAVEQESAPSNYEESSMDITDTADDDVPPVEEVPLPYTEEDDYDIDVRFPEPDLSELLTHDAEITDTPPEYDSIESMGSSTGYIKVNVRTGRDSGIIDGANVAVTATVNGTRIILGAGRTDLSGSAGVFEVPAPSVEFSRTPEPSMRPYSLFDVTVTADGFFNSISVDLPVFSGITSVQTFNMVPLPLMMSPNDETVVYYNQEPDLSGAMGG